jgi:predicted MPP superfamily phosphohydrolase
MKKRWRKFVFVTDSHGDIINWDAAEECAKFVKEFKPDDIIFGGDGLDIRSLRGKAHAQEENESLKDDMNAFKKFMTMLFSGSKADKYYLWGNHEDRLNIAAETSGSAIVRDYAEGLIDEIQNFLRKLGVKRILPFDADEGVLTLGPLRFIHGYVHNVNSTIQQAKHYGLEGGAVLMGDSHRLEQINVAKYKGAVGYACGCLQSIPKARYAKRRLGRSSWANGWAYGYWNEQGGWKVWLAHRVNGVWCYTIQSSID